MSYLTRLLEAIHRLTPVTLVAIVMASGILVLSPDRLASILGTLEFRTQYRGIIGTVFIASISLLTAQGAHWAIRRTGKHRAAKSTSAMRQQWLQDLTPEERQEMNKDLT